MSRVLTLLLLLSPALLWAQEDANEPPANPDKAVETGGTGADAGPAPADESPFDYESSEQISEDLSVSFPVDI